MAKTMKAIWDDAHAAGVAAAKAHNPTPMQVVERANPFDDTSPIVHAYKPVAGGMCGFAWVNIKPGTSKFARWAKANGKVRADSYYGGVTHWVSDYGQSHSTKYAYAVAFAKSLNADGVTAYAMERLD